MKKAPIPHNDKLRLANLNQYHLLDSEPELEFDRIVKLAASIANTKISLVSLVDEDRQWFKAKHGLEANETPRDISYCGHAIFDTKPMIVEDARIDDRFKDNPLCISSPNVVFYAGFPLITNKGFAIGTLCVIDDKPKKLNKKQIELLTDLSRQVVFLIELRHRSHEYNEISKVAKIGYWSIDLNSQQIEWSELMFNLFDRDTQDGAPTYLEFKKMIHPDDLATLENCVYRAKKDKKDYKIQYRIIKKDGSIHWIEEHGELNLNKDKKVFGISGVCQDISKKIHSLKEVEEYQKDLKETNTYLTLALDGAGLGIWDWYLEDNSVKFDENWAKMLGYELSEVEMNINSWESRVHPDDLESCYNDIQNYMNGKSKFYENIHRMKHKEGYWVYILDRGRFSDWDKDGKPIRFTGTHLDITTSKKQEEKILNTKNELSVINKLLKIDSSLSLDLNTKLKNAIDIIVDIPWLSLNPKAGVFLVENNKLKLKVSLELDEKIESMCANLDFEGYLCSKAFENEDVILVSNVDERDEKTFEGISPHRHYNIPILNYNKDIIGFMVFYLPLEHIKDQEEIDFLKSCSDVISQIISAHNYEIDLIAKRDEALAGEKAKTKFLANMSHEIRTPMNGILGTIDMLYETKISKKQKEYLDMAKNGGDHLLNILNDILDISKIDSGKLQIEQVSFNLHECLKNIISINSFNARKKNINLKYTLGDKDYVLKGDLVRIRQILDNYVTNAIKFSENNDVILGYKVVKVTDDEAMFDFYVKDFGIGINEEKLEKLFKTFSQADGSITRKYGGSGLGLSICKKLAELMGGKVYVKSKEGMGSTFGFFITLPLEINEVIKQKEQELGDINTDLSILVVEDNVINQKLMDVMLKSIGLKCVIAANGQVALDLLENYNNLFDIVFMDIQMPVMDGLTATKIILDKYGDLAPIIIAQTANAFSEDQEKCFSVGMKDFISKPIKKIELIKTILKYNFKKKQLSNSSS